MDHQVDPWLIKPGEAQALLGLSPHKLKAERHFRHLLVVKNPAGSKYLVHAYILGLKKYLGARELSERLAQAYSQTPEAKRLIQQAQAHYWHSVHNEPGGFTVHNIMKLFSVRRTVVSRWVTAGKIVPQPKRWHNDPATYDPNSFMSNCPMELPGEG